MKTRSVAERTGTKRLNCQSVLTAGGKRQILVVSSADTTRAWVYRVLLIVRTPKAAQRLLAESIAREFGPQGIHVAYFIIDAAIDTPRTRPFIAPDAPDEFFARPAAIAEEMYRVAHQDRSTWSLD